MTTTKEMAPIKAVAAAPGAEDQNIPYEGERINMAKPINPTAETVKRYVAVDTDVHDTQEGRIARFQHAEVARLGAEWLNGPDATPEDYEWTAPSDARTMAFRRVEPTEEQRAWAAANTARLEVQWSTAKWTRDPDYVEDGDSFREAGTLTIRPCKDGMTRFCANVPEDSIHEDFRYLEYIIAWARRGDMSGWARHTFKNGDEGWRFDYPLYRIKETDQLAPAQVFEGEGWGFVCTEPRCREAWHGEFEENHTLDNLRREIDDYFSYEIEIHKDPTDPDGRWYLNVWPGPEMTEATPEMIATFVNDLNWMAIDCQTANAKEVSK